MGTERKWTKRELEWKRLLEGNPIYEILPLSELYERTPDPKAGELVKAKFGDLSVSAWCKLYWLLMITQTMKKTVVLTHATLNCSACWYTYEGVLQYQWRCGGFQHIPTTAMSRRQVIFGGEEELIKAIEAVDRDYKPQLVIVATGCAASLIHEDIPRIMERVQPRVKAKLYYVNTAGYESVRFGPMIEEVSRIWTDLMDPPERVDPEKVNILGDAHDSYWNHVVGDGQRRFPGEADELGRYIEGLGLKVHRVFWGGDYDYIRTAPEAAVNTVYCSSWGFPLAEAMKAKFGTPYVRHEIPLGVEAPSRWIMGLAELTERQEQAERLIHKEYEQIKHLWEPCKEMVKDKVAISGGIINRGLTRLRMSQELGMDVVFTLVNAESGIPVDIEVKGKHYDVEYFLEYGFNPLVLRLKEGVERDPYLLNLPNSMKALGLEKDEVVYMYPDWAGYAKAGVIDPSDSPHWHSGSQLRRIAGYPSRAVGFLGAAGACLEIMEAIKAAQRGHIPTLYGRIRGKPFEDF